ncbi:hypothetical protein BHF68_02885 [Desulfuribacillus alkaliarsenatis]|uniref:Protein-glutamate methylesterase/protein-glutamine glutaminase n=2 Tax=Desulfuribacillus alkaliarsenatis TaxID=766136 RepID=A0A1E5G6I0_9FIRM|nr:hypothetical protein BHF68_02885 [Desulfuribacillus alkaliarsenatis]
MRKVISDILTLDPEIEVIGTARNGQDSLVKIEKLKPDVVTLDIEMPVLDGISTLREIMRKFPLPVIMLSSLTHEGATETIKALELGAFDFIGKPSGAISLDIHKVQDEIITKVKLAGKNKVRISQIPKASLRDKIQIKHQSPQQSSANQKTHSSETKSFETEASKVNTIIAIGTSTGGPRALQTVLAGLPGDLPASIVVVQHMPAGFTKSLADRLNTLCEINVVEASDNMPLQNGCAYVAPGGKQMGVVFTANNRYKLHTSSQAEPMSGHKPSVDYLFHSIAKINDANKVIVIMTGMGGDGAKGLVSIKKAGYAHSIAEDQSTCIVYGMPRVAIETGEIDIVVPVQDIAKEIIKCVKY